MKIYLVIILFFIMVLDILSQEIPFNMEFHINDFGNSYDIVGLTTNKLLISEHSKDLISGDYHIIAQIYDLANNEVGNAFQVSTYMDEWQLYPSVSRLNSEGFIHS